MCVYIYIYTHILYVCVYTYTCIYIHTYIYVLRYNQNLFHFCRMYPEGESYTQAIDVCVKHLCIDTYMYTYIYIYMYISMYSDLPFYNLVCLTSNWREFTPMLDTLSVFYVLYIHIFPLYTHIYIYICIHIYNLIFLHHCLHLKGERIPPRPGKGARHIICNHTYAYTYTYM